MKMTDRQKKLSFFRSFFRPKGIWNQIFTFMFITTLVVILCTLISLWVLDDEILASTFLDYGLIPILLAWLVLWTRAEIIE